jgi:hypothetical protein
MIKKHYFICLAGLMFFSFFVLIPHEPARAQGMPVVIKLADTGAETLTRNKAAIDVLQEIAKGG